MSMRKRRASLAGFTLMELVVVIMILGILASIAILSYVQYMERVRAAEAKDVLFRCFSGVKRKQSEGFAQICPPPRNNCWDVVGLTDPNNNTERFFNYYARPNWNSNPLSYFEAIRCQGTPCSANNADNTSRWVRINLTNGRITKSAEY